MASAANVMLVLDLARGTSGGKRAMRWYQDSRGFQSLYWEGTDGSFLGGRDGEVYSLEETATDRGLSIPLKLITRFDDQSAPENAKRYQDLLIDHDTKGTELTAKIITDNGDLVTVLGTFASDDRVQTVFPIPNRDGSDTEGMQAKNLAVYLDGSTRAVTTLPTTIYGLILHFFYEPRDSKNWDSGQLDFGTEHVKAVRAIELDICNYTSVVVQVDTDLPDNAIAVRVSKNVLNGAGRRKVQVPIPEYVEGRQVRVRVWVADGRQPRYRGTFQLWGARILLQPYGTYIEAYEGAAGQRYDSFQVDFGTAQMKMARELELDLDTDGAINYDLLSDQPGNNMATRKAAAVNTTTTTTGRRIERIPLEPQGERQYPEGHLWQLRLTGGNAMRLYRARLNVKPYGEFVEGYESAAGRTWNSDVLDLGSPNVKEVREVQLDVDTDGPLTLDVWTELPGLGMVVRVSKTVNTEPTTAGRRMVNLPLGADGGLVEGRLVRLTLSGSVGFRLYGAWVFARVIGYYVEAYQAVDGHIWDSTELDLGSPAVKRLLNLYFEARADAPLTVKTYTSNANGEMELRQTDVITSSAGRRPYTVPLTDLYGRIVRVTISSQGAFRLFLARVYAKPIGVYLNAGTSEVFPVEAEQDLSTERVKPFKEIEVIYAGSGSLEFSSDLPNGDVRVLRTFDLPATTGTETLKLRLPGHAKGRLMRVLLRPSGDLAVFQVRIWHRKMGEAGPGVWDWATLPIPQTPDNYSWGEMYVAPTPPAWAWQEILVPKTAVDWNWVEFPVDKTSELPVWEVLPVEDAPMPRPG